MSSQKPITEIRIGAVKATIWQNGTTDQPRHNVTFSRLYKDGDTWKSTQSFGRNDLLLLAKVADQAHSRIFQLALPDGEEARARRTVRKPLRHPDPACAAGITPRRASGHCGKPEGSTAIALLAREAADAQ